MRLAGLRVASVLGAFRSEQKLAEAGNHLFLVSLSTNRESRDNGVTSIILIVEQSTCTGFSTRFHATL